ncbi:MAG: hypothetical protein ACRDMJ_07690 [Solirubrobacteraceae bacterium]
MSQTSTRPASRAARWRRIATAAATSAVAAGALAATATAAPVTATTPPDNGGNYAFHTVGDSHDPTFNQLLGINNSGVIAGYFGSGMKGHPNRGYVVAPSYAQGQFGSDNFPGAAQTQAIGINNAGDTVGFWVDASGANHGFYRLHGRGFKTVDFPTGDNAKPRVDQLLAIDDSDIAVGFYTDAKGVNHGFSYNIRKRRFKAIKVAGDTNVTVAGINDEHDVAGIATNAAGTTEGFLLRSDGKLFRLDFPGATTTQAFGVNDGDEVVGDYMDGSGSSATTHGFTWSPGSGFATVDDPNGVGSTTLNGVNDRGTIVGFYTDSAGNTDGLLAKGMANQQ